MVLGGRGEEEMDDGEGDEKEDREGVEDVGGVKMEQGGSKTKELELGG